MVFGATAFAGAAALAADPELVRRLDPGQLAALLRDLSLAADALEHYIRALTTHGASPAGVRALVVAYVTLCMLSRTLESLRK